MNIRKKNNLAHFQHCKFYHDDVDDDDVWVYNCFFHVEAMFIFLKKSHSHCNLHIQSTETSDETDQKLFKGVSWYYFLILLNYSQFFFLIRWTQSVHEHQDQIKQRHFWNNCDLFFESFFT